MAEYCGHCAFVCVLNRGDGEKAAGAAAFVFGELFMSGYLSGVSDYPGSQSLNLDPCCESFLTLECAWCTVE